MDHSFWPRITLITPSFNQGAYLEDTILSVLHQDYPNLEYFIVDGGSTDNSLEIIKKFDGRIDWWVSERDRGQSHAINKGLQRATGDIINWINSDDLLFPGALKRVARCYLQHRGAMHLLTGDIARISAEGKILKVSGAPTRWAMSLRNFIIPVGQQSTFFTRQALELGGLLDEDLHAVMDMDYYRRILVRKGRYVRFKGLVGAIRNNPDAKGLAHPELWHQEIPRYLETTGGSPFTQRLDFGKMLVVRLYDCSLVRTLLLTRRYGGKILTGAGLSS